MDRVSGALYVRVGDTVHPVMNLSSARMIAQVDTAPRPVTSADLASAKHGALLGIPGAPGVIGKPLSGPEAGWTVCDDAITTTVIAGPLTGGAASPLAQDEPALVSSRSGRTYLLYNGKRAVVNMADTATVRALHLEGRTPRPVSQALLGIVGEAAPIAAPVIPDLGRPGPQVLPGFVIGDVVRVERASATEYFVVLAGGVQRIGAVAADLIQFATGRPGTEITAVAASVIAAVPTVGVLPVAEFPDRIGAPLAGDVRVLCASWAAGEVTFRAGVALPVRDQDGAVRLAQADGAGPAVDAVYLPPGRSAYIGSAGFTAGTGSVISETGVRFPVGDTESARVLGLPDRPESAPSSLLETLPLGPELDRDAALVARDTLLAESPRPGG